MNLSSHLIVAINLENHLQPDNQADYYLGSIVPDVRYYLGLSREQTHIPIEKILEFAGLYPHLKSFILGYMVHCKVDELNQDLGDIILRRFPLNLIKHRFPAQFAPVLLEYYYLETNTLFAGKRISEAGNEMLDDLCIGRESVVAFSQLFNNFLAAPSLELGLETIQKLGLLSNPGVQRYLDAAKIIQRNWVLRKLLFAGIDIAEFDRRVTAHVLPLPTFT